jgi:RNA polymerase sigma-70 factor (ECF subfamily)
MVHEITDDEAVGRVQSGDTRSYEVLAARYDRSLHRVARRLLRSEADADDIVQRAHLLALSHIDQYRGSGYFRWMYSIIVNEAHTQMRKARHLTNIDDSCTRWLSSPMRDPEQQAAAQDVEQILERAVQSLPSAYQPVFRLREMEELTTAETGERLGLTDSCVKTRLFRAKNMLRRTLKQVQGRADLLRPPLGSATWISNSRPPSPTFEAGSGMQLAGVASSASTL